MAKAEAKKATRASTRRVSNARTPARAAVKVAKAQARQATRKLTRAQQQALLTQTIESQGEAAREKAHDIPIGVTYLEIQSLIENAADQREILALLPSVGTAPLDTLPLALAHLRSTQRAYELALSQASTQAATRVTKEAEKLDRQLVEVARLIHANDSEMLARIDRIVEGSGVADQANDLRALSELLQPHQAVVDAIPTLPRSPLQRAGELAAHLEGSVNRAVVGKVWGDRNAAFWALDTLADQVRAGLRLVFANQPRMLKKVLSRYQAQKRAQSRARAATLKKLGGGQ